MAKKEKIKCKICKDTKEVKHQESGHPCPKCTGWKGECILCNESAGEIVFEEKATNVLMPLLFGEPELAKKLAEAIETERYFITVTFQKKYKPADQHDMHHFWTRKGLNPNDITGAIRHLAADYNAKENPTAADENAGGLY